MIRLGFMSLKALIQVILYLIVGLTGQTFLERNKYKNSENGHKYYQITDFEIFKSLKINSFSFYIFDADDYTKKWFLENLNK